MDMQRKQAFAEEYNALCHKYGMQIVLIDQRQQVDGIWIIKNPSLDVQEIPGWQPSLVEDKDLAEEAKIRTNNGTKVREK